MSRGRVLVVGAGTMGRGIAASCALAEWETWVFDADPGAQGQVRAAVDASWARAVEKGKLDQHKSEAARHRLHMPARLKDAADADFVIEAVPEAMDLKRLVFSELDDLCPPRTILASNTSSLPISEIARATGRRDRVVGIHFFNPVATMPLVELVRGRETSEETLRRAAELVASLGKETIVVRDSPGFATSRLGVALGLEAMRMVEEGVASAADIDRAMEMGYGHRMGPLKTSDLVGLDIRLAIAETLERELSEPRFRPPEILRRKVEAGHTGRKAGRGFYLWEGEKPVPLEETPATKTPA
jgi:3-hydroxybutyryl-CoA dehydrogenase